MNFHAIMGTLGKQMQESKNAEGWTPLIWGSMNGHEEVVAALLNAKSQVQAIDAQGLSALMWATRHGHVSVMKSILATGPDLSLRDFAGHTVMHHARQHRAARKMLQQFEELNRQLLNSAKSGDIGQASMALQAGAYVDALDHQGSSPLLLAASQRDFTMVKLLTRHGADLSLEASRTNSPWMRNIEYRTNIQEVLRDAVKANRLLVSSAKDGYWKGVFQAIDHGAWLDLPDESHRTALAWASGHGNAHAVRELLQAGASVDLRDTCGWTPLAWAAHKNWPKVASILQHHKADLHTRTFTGDTLAHLAAKSNHCFTLALLSLAGVDLDLQDFEGHSPLQATVISGKFVATKCLLLLRANPELKDEGGRSIVALAASHGQHALLEHLLPASLAAKPAAPGPSLKAQARKTVIPGRADANLEAFKAGRKSLKEEKADAFKVRRSMKPEGQVASQAQVPGLPPVVEDQEDASPISPTSPNPLSGKNASPGTQDASPHSAHSASGDDRSPERSEKSKRGKERNRQEHSKDPPGKADSEKGSKEEFPKEGKGVEAEDAELRPEEPRERKKVVPETEMADLQLYWKAEALFKQLPKKLDFSVSKALSDVDNDGRTPLGLAVLAAHPRVVTLLLERKASIESTDREGNTVLMLAASSPSRNAFMIVELLLSLNADVQAENQDKLRAVDMAKAPKVRHLLQSHMDRLEVGRKLKSSQSLPALKVREPASEDGPHPAGGRGWEPRGGRVRLESLPDLPLDQLEEAILSLVSQRRAPVPQQVQVVVHPITQRSLGYAYVDYEDEGTATLLADAKCDLKKDPFRGTVRVLKEVTTMSLPPAKPRGSLAVTE